MAGFVILEVGSGGRETRALERFVESPDVRVHVAPGSTGMLFNLNEEQRSRVELHSEIRATDIKAIVQLAKKIKPDMVFVGPEAPLIRGLANALHGICRVFGFDKVGARLEGSKMFAKSIYQHLGLPTAKAIYVRNAKHGHQVLDHCEREGRLVVLKCDTEAAGKGVIVRKFGKGYWEELHRWLDLMMDPKAPLGYHAKAVLIEEMYPFLREWSAMTIVGPNETTLSMMPVNDFKEFHGENTGGMGFVAPAIGFSMVDMVKRQEVVIKVLKYLRQKYGVELCGILYEGLNRMGMIDYLVEINCRGGDPETQAQLDYLIGVAFHEILLAAYEGDKATLSLVKVPENLVEVGIVVASKGYPGNYSAEKGKEITFPDELPAGGSIVPAGFSWDGKVARITGGRVAIIKGKVINPDQVKARKEARAIALEIVHAIKHGGALVWREDIGAD